MFRTSNFLEALSGKKKLYADLFFMLSEKYFAIKKNSTAYINYG
jgi:hypothetical protein